ncbi:hypothetical protein BDW66DRAFT_148498 [Aspergillus desertorum]
MQAYLQYRDIRDSVRKQLNGLPERSDNDVEQASSGSSLRRRPSQSAPISGVRLIDNPNISLATRVAATSIVSGLAFVVSVSSSIESAVTPQSSADYGASEVVASFSIAIFLLGFATGSLISGPLSEILRCNVVYQVSISLFKILVMGSGLSPNTGA